MHISINTKKPLATLTDVNTYPLLVWIHISDAKIVFFQ